jgi:hypothetical protein
MDALARSYQFDAADRQKLVELAGWLAQKFTGLGRADWKVFIQGCFRGDLVSFRRALGHMGDPQVPSLTDEEISQLAALVGRYFNFIRQRGGTPVHALAHPLFEAAQRRRLAHRATG